MASENRAAAALGHSYPGGIEAFVAAMNEKAKVLGLTQTHYVDSSGLSPENVSSPGHEIRRGTRLNPVAITRRRAWRTPRFVWTRQ